MYLNVDASLCQYWNNLAAVCLQVSGAWGEAWLPTEEFSSAGQNWSSAETEGQGLFSGMIDKDPMFQLKGPYFTPFWDLIWGIGPPNMIYQWFKVGKTAAMCISMSSLLSLWSCRQNRLFSPASWALIWLADCTLSDTRPGLSPVSFTLAVNTAESQVMFGYIYSRPATYLQSITTGCFWTLSYTVLMFVQVLAGESANVGVTSRVTVRSFTTEFQYGVTSALWGRKHETRRFDNIFLRVLSEKDCGATVSYFEGSYWPPSSHYG